MSTSPTFAPDAAASAPFAPGPDDGFVKSLIKSRDYIANPVKRWTYLRETYGDVVRIALAGQTFNLVMSPEGAKQILLMEHKQYHKGLGMQFIRKVLGNGLLTSEGSFWLRQRRIAQPAFHREYLKTFADTMVESTDWLLDRWEERYENADRFDLAKEMNKLTLDIVARTLLSTNVRDASTHVSRVTTELFDLIIDRVNTYSLMPNWVPKPSMKRVEVLTGELDKIVFGMIKERRQQREADRPRDLLSMLMAASDADTGETMSDKQVRDEILTMFIAGHETTALALGYLLYEVAQHPDIEDKLLKEINRVTDGEKPGAEHVREMTYLRQVIDETMRLYPPAYALTRRPVHRTTVLGYQVTPQMSVVVLPIIIHRHPDFWQRPLAFDPERFAPENVKQHHKYQYIPFGGGPRLCIGNNFALMEMQLCVARILQRYRLEVVEAWKLETQTTITLRPKYGIGMRIAGRR
ncbi:MAG: cytochrome P450 [Bacteroidota bacterium]